MEEKGKPGPDGFDWAVGVTVGTPFWRVIGNAAIVSRIR